MPIDSCSLAALRYALRHLYEPRLLQSSPLAGLKAWTAAGDAALSLRLTLTRAIEALQPGPDAPPQAPARRAYEILYYRYVQQSTTEEVAEQLGLSLRHLKREHRKALERLAQYLGERYHVHIELSETEGSGMAAEPDDEEAESAAEEVGTVSPELRWATHSPHGQATELQAVLPAVLKLVQPVAARHEVTVQAPSLEGLPAVAADGVTLRQMLLSVLCVAIPRSAGGALCLAAGAHGWQVEVRMSGRREQPASPLSPEDAANLEVAQQLAQGCGGNLAAPADAPCFTATLALPVAQQVTVLAIDDHADALQLLQRYVTGTRYRVVGARHAQEALALAVQVSPRIIVLDVMMPEVDGWELLGRLREHPLTRDVPVVACTITAQEELAEALGVSAFLRKPVTRADFLAALDRLAGCHTSSAPESSGEDPQAPAPPA